MALLSGVMGLPAFGKDKSLYVQGLDRLIAEYQRAGSDCA
jgi:hypothetical protein